MNFITVAAKKEKWLAKNKTEKTSDEKKCSFIPGAFGMCFMSNVVRVSFSQDLIVNFLI